MIFLLSIRWKKENQGTIIKRKPVKEGTMNRSRIAILLVIVLFVPYLAQAANAAGEDALLKTIGASLAGNLYFAYMTIGAMADGFEKEVYTADQMESLMQANDKLLSNITDVIKESMTKYKYSKEDLTYIKGVIDAIKLLQSMSNSVEKYSQDKSTDTADEFAGFRKKAWAKISSLLGLEGEK
jgi:hypothetical protein